MLSVAKRFVFFSLSLLGKWMVGGAESQLHCYHLLADGQDAVMISYRCQ